MARQHSNAIGLKGGETDFLVERLETMSHEFRTPLNIIIGFTELLLDEVPGKINDEQRRSLNDIYNSAQRLLGLVKDVFDRVPPGS